MATNEAIAALLFQDWDPIGVNDVAPADEYAEYAGPLATMLAQGASVDEVCAYLTGVRTFQMRLGPDPGADARIAAALLTMQRKGTRCGFAGPPREAGDIAAPAAEVTIYVRLLDELVAVWRPVPARRIGDLLYEIVGNDGDRNLEIREFRSGDRVRVAPREFSDGAVLVAVSKAP